MSAASEREKLLPIINHQESIICELAELCKYQQDLLSQYMNTELLEDRLKKIAK